MSKKQETIFSVFLSPQLWRHVFEKIYTDFFKGKVPPRTDHEGPKGE